jgi:uncharacterized phosphosugar-binding protein
MLGERYIERLRTLLSFMEDQQLPTIRDAAEAIAERLATGGALHIHDTGHLLNQELVHRAGGLLAMTPLQFGMSVNNPVSAKHAARKGATGPYLGLTDVALDASGLAAGDAVIIGSVSGRNPEVVDVAIKAKERGALIVVLTSVTYSSQVASKHPSGKRLFEVGDFVIDNGSDLGDASLEVEGLPVKAVPTSGIGAAIAAWVLVAEVIERLVAKGCPPQVFASANLDWGVAFNDEARRKFAETGL